MEHVSQYHGPIREQVMQLADLGSRAVGGAMLMVGSNRETLGCTSLLF